MAHKLPDAEQMSRYYRDSGARVGDGRDERLPKYNRRQQVEKSGSR